MGGGSTGNVPTAPPPPPPPLREGPTPPPLPHRPSLRHQSRSCAPGKPQCPECGLTVASCAPSGPPRGSFVGLSIGQLRLRRGGGEYFDPDPRPHFFLKERALGF